jgi:hypothetical protein
LFDNLPDVITSVSQSARAVSMTPGITVTEKYDGMQPNTRVFFNVQFNGPTTTPVKVVVPGYGSVVITPVTSTGAPVNGACPYIALQSNQITTFQLTGNIFIGNTHNHLGTSPIYHDSVIAQIVTKPTTGRLFQYDSGVKGDPISDGDLVSDLGNR